MRERGILFSGPMVRAILAGTKSQTRRVVKPQPDSEWWPVGGLRFMREGATTAARETVTLKCPYGVPGDRLWVRETWMDLCGTGIEPFTAVRTHYAYGADTPPGSYGDECRKEYGLKWRPSIHMPRLASRITLEITDVRVERLQEISEADAIAEGIGRYDNGTFGLNDPGACMGTTAVVAYMRLWESINGPGSWDANPYVWAITFRRIGDA